MLTKFEVVNLIYGLTKKEYDNMSSTRVFIEKWPTINLNSISKDPISISVSREHN